MLRTTIASFRGGTCAAVSGINLQRYLPISSHIKSISKGAQNRLNLIDRQQRGSAAAKVDRIDDFKFFWFVLTPGADLLYQRANVSFGCRALVHSRREIAVRAPRAAEGDVNVNAGMSHLVEV